MRISLLIFAVLLCLPFPASSSWWNNSYQQAYNGFTDENTRPYVMTLNISNNTGASNATHINLTCSAPNCRDIRFVLDNTTELPYWREWNSTSQEYGKYYVNVTGIGDVQIYYNSTNHTDGANGNKTFALFDDFSDKPSNLAGDRPGYPTWGIISGTWIATDGYLKTTSDQAKINTNASRPSLGRTWEFRVRNPAASASMFLEIAFSHVVATPAGQGYEYYFNGAYKILKNQSALVSTFHVTDAYWHYITLHRDENGIFSTYENATLINTATDSTMIYQQFFGAWHQSSIYEGNIDMIREYAYTTVDQPKWISWNAYPKPPPPAIDYMETNGCGFDTDVNNTNLAPEIDVDVPGTGERVSGNVYWSNKSEKIIFVYAHASSASQIAEIHLHINGDKVLDVSGRALGGAEQNNKSITAIIPKGVNYSVDFTNYHHYEWREWNRTMNISECDYPENNNSLNYAIEIIAIAAMVIGFCMVIIASRIRK